MKKRKRKVGIITLYGLYNHGNRLQNIALQKILENKGFVAETIVCRKSMIRELARTGINFCKAALNMPDSIRYVNFYHFVKNNTNIKFIFKKNGLIPDSISNDYEYFLVGSDQVWNPEVRKKDIDNFFLRFAKRDQRICISPSIAVNEIDPIYRREYIDGLNGFRYLSSREDSGAKIIMDTVGRQAEVLIDPTMMLTKNEWYNICKPIELPCEKYILQLFLEPLDDKRKQKILTMAKELNAVIIDIADIKTKKYYSAAPDAFLQLIDHAALVCTDSFHAVAFSINFNIPFYVFKRISQLESSNRMYSRIETILHKFALESRTEENYNKNGMMECDFRKANIILEGERRKFNAYLDMCLNQKITPNVMNLDEEKCTGCECCAVTCPLNCISIKADAEGFYIPSVDEKKCINCGKCAKICPVMSKEAVIKHDVSAVAAYSNDKMVVLNSSSGGVFFHLASYVIDKNGVVFGAAFDEKAVVRHIMIEAKENINKLQGSKYIQSDIGKTYISVKEELNKDRIVLFVGTPCQIAGLKKYLGKEYTNLYLCDFVCHGVPSPEIWKMYLEENFDKDIVSINMRCKEKGWNNYSTRIKYNDGSTCIMDRKSSAYNKAFESNLIIRKSCFNCYFKGVERISDITLGDLWGVGRLYPDLENKEGTSILLIQTQKGKQIINAISDEITINPIDLNTYVGKANMAMIKSPDMNPYRNKLYRHMNQPITEYLDIVSSRCQQQNNSFRNKLKRKIKRIVHLDK